MTTAKAQLQKDGYPLTASTWDKREFAAIQRVLDSGRFTMGENVARFQEAFARFVGAKNAVMVNSGSSANLLAVAAATLRKSGALEAGDEVIVPSLSWSTTYYPLHQYGMKLVFVDIDGETLNIDPRNLKGALSRRTRALFIPDILGNPAPWDELSAFAEKHDLVLLEDNCESLGARLQGRHAGTFGLMGTYSMFYSHHITTMEGGVITTDDEELHHILLSLRAHGWTRNLPKENRLVSRSDDPFMEAFRFILPGYNLRPTELNGAIGLEQLEKLPALVAARRRNADHFRDRFADDSRFRLQREHGESSWFGFSMVLRDPKRLGRARVLEALRAANVEVRPVVSGNFLRQPVVKLLDRRVVGRHPNSNRVHDHGFFVGNHGFDLRDQIDLMREVLAPV